MSGAEVIENSISVQGMRWVHVVQMGAAVDVGEWMGKIARHSRELAEFAREHERGLDLHHLRVWWPAREPVTLRGLEGGERPALLWRMERGQRLREAALYAGLAYVDYFGRWPNMVRVSKLPAGATAEFELYADEEERIMARLVTEDWVPKNFMVLEECNG